MAENWSAYGAAKELYGNNVENIQDIGSRFPLFSRAVMQINDDALLDVLAAIPKVTARMMETGLKTMSDGDVVETETEAVEEKPAKKATPKSKKIVEDEDDMDYASMTAKDLYALCCARGLSGKCKKRNKDFLISVLEAADEEKDDSAEEEKKPVKKTEKEKAKAEEPDDDDWGDDEEEETEKDPYEGKGAVELFKLCKKRGIATKPKLKSAEYIKLLKKADEAEAEPEEEDDEDDEWEI